jgi:hypothetical protein
MPDVEEPQSKMFAEPAQERAFPATAVGIAVVAVVILIGVIVMLARRPASPASAAYAPNLVLSDVKMSEADSREGFGKLIYIEGHVANRGGSVVTGVRVQVSFGNDAGPAQIETVPMNVVYMREPYVDTRAVTVGSPLAPGTGADFRLIFDDVKDVWNQQMPTLLIASVATK